MSWQTLLYVNNDDQAAVAAYTMHVNYQLSENGFSSNFILKS